MSNTGARMLSSFDRSRLSCAGANKVQVFDPKSPTKPLCTATLSWKSADVTYKVELVEQVVKLSPAKAPGPQMMLAGVETPGMKR